jgi:hypothetical protein
MRKISAVTSCLAAVWCAVAYGSPSAYGQAVVADGRSENAQHGVDLNGDGRADLATTGVSGWTGLPVAFSNGNGSFNVTNSTTANFAAWNSAPGAKVLPPPA